MKLDPKKMAATVGDGIPAGKVYRLWGAREPVSVVDAIGQLAADSKTENPYEWRQRAMKRWAEVYKKNGGMLTEFAKHWARVDVEKL